MSQHKSFSLDQIQLENVSYRNNGYDSVLVHVDLELPMDQNVIVQSSNPTHAVHFLEILAGLKEPQTGKVKWSDLASGKDDLTNRITELMGYYFESLRPDPKISVNQLLQSTGASIELMAEVYEHFELFAYKDMAFKDLTYQLQKLVLMINPTLKMPQMLILEDPASGISEQVFLNFLDWIQMWQRQGHIRHVYLTNHHPTAARHLEANHLYIEDGLVYLDQVQGLKKVVHF